ncbi:MAG: hypothetical protein M3421_08230 [Bacteroidota bacterium]|jgi:hypothetical protein|nr:hypothetical protein [Bacteroidota bacterium]
MEKEPLYLKCIFEDGLVYFKVSKYDHADDEYIYEGTELIYENEAWNIDHYDLTQEDIEEMYKDDFCNIGKEEYEEAFVKANLNIKK